MANSRSGLEGGLAGLKAAERIATMFGLHDAKKVGGRLVLRLLLPRAPFQQQAVAETPQHRHQTDRAGPTHPAGVLPMQDVQTLGATGGGLWLGRWRAVALGLGPLSWDRAAGRCECLHACSQDEKLGGKVQP